MILMILLGNNIDGGLFDRKGIIRIVSESSGMTEVLQIYLTGKGLEEELFHRYFLTVSAFCYVDEKIPR